MKPGIIVARGMILFQYNTFFMGNPIGILSVLKKGLPEGVILLGSCKQVNGLVFLTFFSFVCFIITSNTE